MSHDPDNKEQLDKEQLTEEQRREEGQEAQPRQPNSNDTTAPQVTELPATGQRYSPSQAGPNQPAMTADSVPAVPLLEPGTPWVAGATPVYIGAYQGAPPIHGAEPSHVEAVEHQDDQHTWQDQHTEPVEHPKGIRNPLEEEAPEEEQHAEKERSKR